MNANTIIATALKICGVLAAGESPAAADATDAFNSLNSMLDRWKAENLTAYKQERYTVEIPNGLPTLTIGPTGDLVIAQGTPVAINQAASIINFGVAESEFEMAIKVFTNQEWAVNVPMKTMTNSLPIGIFYQRGAPNGTITIWPIVNQTGIYLALYAVVPLDAFPDRVTDVPLLPGYDDALTYGLAKRLAPMFGRQLDPVILDEANEAMRVVKVSNENWDVLSVDEAIAPRASGAWNYRTGDWQL